MSLEVIDNEIQEKEITAIRRGECKSLSGKAKLSYSISQTSGSELLVKIEKSSTTGKFNPQYISLSAIDEIIKKAEPPFSWTALAPLFKHQSTNNQWYVGAICVKEGIVESVEGGYQRTNKGIKTLIKKPSRRKTI